MKLPASLHTLALTTQGYRKLGRLVYSNELLITSETDRDKTATVNLKDPGPKRFFRPVLAKDRPSAYTAGAPRLKSAKALRLAPVR